MYFPKYFEKNAKSLVKKILTADLSKRYGNLKNGPMDIIDCKWFHAIDLKRVQDMTMEAPYKPDMKNADDISNFEDVPDSNEVPPAVKGASDPFVEW